MRPYRWVAYLRTPGSIVLANLKPLSLALRWPRGRPNVTGGFTSFGVHSVEQAMYQLRLLIVLI